MNKSLTSHITELSSSGVKKYIVNEVHTHDEISKIERTFKENFSYILDHDADVYRINEYNEAVPLFYFRKNVLNTYMPYVLESLKKDAKRASNTRTTASGIRSKSREKLIFIYSRSPIWDIII